MGGGCVGLAQPRSTKLELLRQRCSARQGGHQRKALLQGQVQAAPKAGAIPTCRDTGAAEPRDRVCGMERASGRGWGCLPWRRAQSSAKSERGQGRRRAALLARRAGLGALLQPGASR